MRVINVVKPFKITLRDNSQLSFGTGPQEVTDEVADHFWTKNFVQDQPEIGSREYAVAATLAKKNAQTALEAAQAEVVIRDKHAADAWAAFEKTKKDASLGKKAARQSKDKPTGSVPHAAPGGPDELTVDRRQAEPA